MLDFFTNTIYTAGAFLDGVLSLIYKLFLTIDAVIYSFVNWLYQIFLILARVEFFKF